MQIECPVVSFDLRVFTPGYNCIVSNCSQAANNGTFMCMASGLLGTGDSYIQLANNSVVGEAGSGNITISQTAIGLQAAVASDLDIMLGGPVQAINSYMSAAHAAKGLAPVAYRDLAYVFFRNLVLENYGNKIPSFQFEVNRIITEQTSVAIVDILSRAGISATDATTSGVEGVSGEFIQEDTGFLFAQVADEAYLGTVHWNTIDVNRLCWIDGSCITTSLTKDQYSYYLRCRAYNSNIPNFATITGVEVSLYRRYINGTVIDQKFMMGSDAAGWSVDSCVPYSWPTMGQWGLYKYGGPFSTFGLTLTPSLVNNANFGFRLACGNLGSTLATLYIDQAYMTIWYYCYGVLSGLTLSGKVSAQSALEPLMVANDLIAYCDETKLVIKPRSSATVVPIPVADLSAHEEKEDSFTAGLLLSSTSDYHLPKSISVRYIEQDTDYSPGQQTDTLAYDGLRARDAGSIELPIAMAPARARGIAGRLLYQAWMNRTSVELSLPPKYMGLLPGSVITTTVEGVVYNIYVSDVDRGFNHIIKVKGVLC
jgi:hypothetical protein